MEENYVTDRPIYYVLDQFILLDSWTADLRCRTCEKNEESKHIVDTRRDGKWIIWGEWKNFGLYIFEW